MGWEGVRHIAPDHRPALPAPCPSGPFRGLCARGGIIVDCPWQNGRVKSFSLLSPTDRPVVVRVPGIAPQTVNCKAGKVVRVSPAY